MGLILSHEHFEAGLSLRLVAEEKLGASQHEQDLTRGCGLGRRRGRVRGLGSSLPALRRVPGDTSRDTGPSARPDRQIIYRYALVLFVLIILRFSHFYAIDNFCFFFKVLCSDGTIKMKW